MRNFGFGAGALALALVAASCSSGSSVAPSGDTGAGGSVQAKGGLAFLRKGTLTLAPSALHDLTVIATPPRRVSVRFALLGDALDASLDRVSVTTDETGRGSVKLRAPDAATTFRVRATIENGPTAEAEIAVSAQGFGTLEVVPVYAGKRSHSLWTAAVVARSTCASLQGLLPEDPPGALFASSVGTPVITGAPVGPSLAVAVRSGGAMWGCTDTAALAANQTLTVKVNVVDRPIDLSTTKLDLTFEYAPEPMAYATLLADASERLAEGALPMGAEATVLLDAMAAGLDEADASAFAEQRAANGWDDTVETALGADGTALRHAVLAFAEAGLAAQSHLLTARLSALPGTAEHALFELLQLGDVDAAAAGIPAAHLASFSANADDMLQLGATLYWLPSRYVGAAALTAAKVDMPSAKTMPDALASLASCGNVATLLGSAGSCDSPCLEAKCVAALAARWELGLDASALESQVGELTLTATAAAELDETARPTGFDGTWLGTVADGSASASVEGAVTATVAKPLGSP